MLGSILHTDGSTSAAGSSVTWRTARKLFWFARDPRRVTSPATLDSGSPPSCVILQQRYAPIAGIDGLNSLSEPNKPFHLPACESGGTADAQGSGPCERKLVGVQVPPLASVSTVERDAIF